MSKIKHYDLELKKQVIEAVTYGGLAVSEAANQYGVHHKTIYAWLKSGGTVSTTATSSLTSSSDPNTSITYQRSVLLQYQKLQQENKELKELLGLSVYDLAKVKKKYNIN